MEKRTILENSNTRSNNLTLIKFIAAIMVIWGHAIILLQQSKDPISLLSRNELSLGSVAVAIFFFASGFYVTKSLMKKRSAGEYLKNRILRIYPAFFIVLFLTVFVLGPCVSSLSFSEYFKSKDTYMYFLYIAMIPRYTLPGVFENNLFPSIVNGSLWTLILEVICYVLLYITYKLKILEKNKLKKINIIMFICIIIIFGFKIPFLYNWKSYLRPLFVFVMGIEYYIFRDEIKLDLCILAGTIGASILILKLGFGDIFTIICVPYILSMIIFDKKQVSEKIAFGGKYSYEMYLVAFPIQQTLIQFLPQMHIIANIVISVGLSLLLGMIINFGAENISSKIENYWI